MSNEKTSNGKEQPQVMVFIDEAYALPIEEKAFRDVVEFLKPTFPGVPVDAAPIWQIPRDEHDDLILPAGFAINKDYLTYPVPADVEPVAAKPGLELPQVEQQIGRIVRQSKPDSDEFTP